jgi:hypothetical protein
MVTKDEIQGSGVFTQEMKKLLMELAEMINYARASISALIAASPSRSPLGPSSSAPRFPLTSGS